MMTNLQIKIFSISKLLLFSICAFVFTLIVQIPGKAAASANYTQTTETINGVNYSVITVNYSGDDAGPAVNEAIAAAKTAAKPVILDFPKATYHFKDSSAIDAQYYISNTTTESETPGGWRKVGLLFKNISDLTIRGNDSTLMFHGVMTPIVFDHATNVNMKSINFDFKRPVMSEMTVVAVGSNYIEMNVHPDSLYKIVNNKLQWTGEVDNNGIPTDNWVARGYANTTQVQEFDPATNKTWRVSNPIASASSVQDMGNRKLRFTYSSAPNLTVGHTYQLRNDSRKEEGAFIYRSKDIMWTGVNFYATPGLGIVGQYSENLTFDQLNFAPKSGGGRTNASMADFMQISGCKGQITVNNSNFFGAHDDPINVHGTHLQIVDKPAPNQIKVQFKHSQSWGFDAFAVNDSIDFINGSTLLSAGSAVVTGVTRVDDYNILLTLDQNVPSSVTANSYFVENATWNPNVTITGSTFESIATRGILVTTRGNVLIDHNTFNRTEMSAILIADDANSWYESGMVRNVTISNNTFNNTGNSVISIEPSAPSTNPDKTVHSNINISGNTFYKTGGTTSIYAGSINGFNFTNNTAQEGGLQINAQGSKNVKIAGNTFAQSGVTKEITLSNMYTNTDTIDASQSFTVTRNNNYVPVVPGSNDIPQSQMTATATSQHSDNEASKALDGDSSSFWHTEWSPMANLPQSVTINLGGTYSIAKLRYLPRQDSSSNGVITGYTISTSIDGITFTNAVSGTWADDKTVKNASFPAVSAKYVKLTATSGHGGYASVAELNIERSTQ
ncbi:discoidin domain-containing protein [Bacillus toyonensis]|uniref:discoidin domain-containing protein n=1 Tax=Bacillus toyonensis TaxID=155322 RepID=UPI00115586BE|nr:discoidin domain-containing protein [Bacillus toyonensis]